MSSITPEQIAEPGRYSFTGAEVDALKAENAALREQLTEAQQALQRVGEACQQQTQTIVKQADRIEQLTVDLAATELDAK